MNGKKNSMLLIPYFCVAIILIYCTVLIVLGWINHPLSKYILNFGSMFTSAFICCLLHIQLSKDIEKDRQAESIAPTLMVAQGTLFTFIGVSYILYNYDPSQSNIADLLGGLKLAFVTSVIGLFASILARARIYDARQRVSRSANSFDDKLVDERDLYLVMCEISTKLNTLEGINHELNVIGNTIVDIRKYQVLGNASLENLEVNISNSLGKSNAMMLANLDNAYRQLQNNMAGISELLMSNIKECFGDIKNTTEDTSKILIEIMDNTKNISGHTAIINNHFANMKESASQTDARFQSIKEYLGETMVSANNYAEATTKAMDAVTDAISRASIINTSFTENVSNISSVINTIDTSATNVSQVLSKLSETSEKVTGSVERLYSTVDNYGEINKQFVNSSQTMVDNVKAYFDKMKNTTQETGKALMEIRDTTRSISRSSVTVDKHFISMQEHAEETEAKFQSIKDYLGETVNSAKDYAEAANHAMDAAAEAVSKVANINMGLSEKAVNAIGDSVTNITDALDKVCTTSSNVAESVEKLHQTVDEYSALNEKFVNNLRDTDGLYQNLQENVVNISESMLTNVKECFGEIKTATAETGKILVDIRDDAKNISSSTASIDGHFESIRENAATTDTNFQSIKEYLGGTMESAKDYAEATTKAMNAAADTISKVSSINTNFAENVANISSAVNAIDVSAANISDVLNKVSLTSNTVAASVERMSQTVGEYSVINEKLVKTLKDTNIATGIEQFAVMQEDLSKNMQNQLIVVNSLSDSMNKLQNQFDNFKELDNFMARTFDNSNTMVKAIQIGSDKIAARFEELSDVITQKIVAVGEKSGQKSMEAVNSYSKQVEKAMIDAQNRYYENMKSEQAPLIEAIANTFNALNAKVDRNNNALLRGLERLNEKMYRK